MLQGLISLVKTRNEEKVDCMRCEEIACLDLFDKSEDSVDAGNEMYVYSLLSNKIEENDDLRRHICTNGFFLMASCFLSTPIYDDFEKSYLSDILMQVTRDFKASIFLAFSGHYRQSLQVLRCAFENLITGNYYQSDLVKLVQENAKKEHFDRLERRYKVWRREGRCNIHKEIEVLRRVGFLSIDEERAWHNLYSSLSKFVHTPEEFTTRVRHGGEIHLKGEIVCCAETYYNEQQLIEWSDYFQRVFTIMLKTIMKFHPKAFDTESGKLARENIESEIANVSENIAVEIKQILSI